MYAWRKKLYKDFFIYYRINQGRGAGAGTGAGKN